MTSGDLLFQQERRKLELDRLKLENENLRNAVRGSSSTSSNSTNSSITGLGDLQERLANLGLTQQEKLMGLSNRYRTIEGGTQGQIDEQAFRRQSAENETKKYMQEKDITGTNFRQERDITGTNFRQGRDIEGMNFRQGVEIGSRERMQTRGFDNVEVQRSRDAARAQGALRSMRSGRL